jgi:alpha-galactosidase
MTMLRSCPGCVHWIVGAAGILAACTAAPDSEIDSELVGDGRGASIALPAPELHAMPPGADADGDLALTPPMGFNDWNAFGCDVSEQLIRDTADFFVSSGLKDAGYQYVNIDDCWLLHERGPDGRLVPDPDKFPSGISGTADYVHSLGLKLGIYEDAGTATCAGFPGSLGHEEIDAQTFAEWGVDYLKYDNCNNDSDGSREDYVARYTAMAEALQATGRPIVYSICEWGTSQPWEWAFDVGNLWRTTGDIQDSWGSLKSIIAQNAPLAAAARPGAWNDPDMLEIGNGGMTTTEYETHFAMWAMMAAPLLIGTDLRDASADTLRILSSPELIAVDQDPLGAQAEVVRDADGTMVLTRPLADGDRAVALYNATDTTALIAIDAADAGLPPAAAYRMTDLWTGEVTQTAGVISASVAAHASGVFRVAPQDDASGLPPSTTLALDVPGAVEGSARPAVLAGQDSELTASFANQGVGEVRSISLSAEVPDGWTVRAQGKTCAAELATGESLAASFTVGVPERTAPGIQDIRVSASYAWGPDRIEAASTSTVTVLVLAPPPGGQVGVSSLPWASATSGWGPVEIDTSNGEQPAGDGNPITIGGAVYQHGLGAHAPGEIVFYLGGRCTALTTDVGLDDEKSANGSASFTVLADDRVAAESGTLTVDDPAMTLTADLTGATWLRLVTDPGPSTDSDHTDWAEPTLTCAE